MPSRSKLIAVAVLFISLAAFSTLHLAAQPPRLRTLAATGTPEEIQTAIKDGANVNENDGAGVTALMAAAGSNQDASVIPVLLRLGADINARSRSGETAMIYAAEYNQSPETIAVLLKSGASIDDTDLMGRTVLIHAARCNPNPDIIPALLKAGASLNRYDTNGMTPLMYAAWENPNPSAVVAVLLKAGADGRIRSFEGMTAFDYAMENPVIQRDAQVMSALQAAAK